MQIREVPPSPPYAELIPQKLFDTLTNELGSGGPLDFLCINSLNQGIPGCVFAMVLALEQDTVIKDLVIQPGSDALKIDGSPDSFFSHEFRGEEVRNRSKGLVNDFRWEGSVITVIDRGFASNGLSVLLLQSRATNAEASGQVVLAFGTCVPISV